ncbi:protein translocase subunit SecD [Roseospirillum parvum]|uniref:Protein translocase subunit SecD n=1 Tax=Roseospirillum parvum TaxID=83401 RepID=A0A1G7Y0P3_9PROT|nr:protein translocase subunit SecD [Roseospirillum parvum]SDG89971.1 preprotein translocase subunit SecD [Roseospirillum parvum]
MKTLDFPLWKVVLVLAVTGLGVVFALPNLMPRSTLDAAPAWWQPVNLGLDLQGGSYLLLEVEIGSVVEEQLEAAVEGLRAGLGRERIQAGDERIMYRDLGVRDGVVSVRIIEPAQLPAARQVIEEIDPALEVEEGAEGRFTLTMRPEAIEERRSQVVDQSIEIVRRRIDELGTREPTIQRQGDSRIIVEVPGIDDPAQLKRTLGKTAKMAFHLLDPNVGPADLAAGRVPPGTMLLPAANPEPGRPFQYAVRRKVEVSGDHLVDSQPTFQDNLPVVSFRFDTAGGRRFCTTTQQNVGRNLAIVLDDEVISAPEIKGAICGGNGVIEGGFTVQSANQLALLLRAGALPAPLTILEERTVGPGLGEDSIRAGAFASALGLLLVVVFMLGAYGMFGAFATLALAGNLSILLGVLSGLGATLTLPGIAGIVLTVGMAVDANVLIFERMKEEMRGGRSVMSAVDAGFRHAFKAIIDANITTLVAALLLFQFGSGPVRGFAVTLGVGVLTSMFTAIMLTRLMVVVWLKRRKPKILPIG